MQDYYLGQIILTSFGRVMQGWMLCNGQVISIDDHEGLFELLGTTYGGDGKRTFGLPDLNGAVPIGVGLGDAPGAIAHVLGSYGGSDSVVLTESQIPAHTHPVYASSALSASPTFGPDSVYGTGVNVPSANVDAKHFVNPVPSSIKYTTLANGSVSTVGSSQPHSNLMPGVGLCYQICTMGVYPSSHKVRADHE